ncbi:MAG: hypothetical protein ACOYT8_03860 [Candidatus Dependentiae bacterium]
MSKIILILLLGIKLQSMEHKNGQWNRGEAISFFEKFFQLPQELQEKIWCYADDNYRSDVRLCIKKITNLSQQDEMLTDSQKENVKQENLIVGPNKNGIIVSSSRLYDFQNLKTNQYDSALPCGYFVYAIDFAQNRWIQAREKDMRIFEYDRDKGTINPQHIIVLKENIAAALFKAKNMVITYSKSGIEEHLLKKDKSVTSRVLIANAVIENSLKRNAKSGQIHLVTDMTYCQNYPSFVKLCCCTSWGWKTLLFDLKSTQLLSIFRGYVKFINEPQCSSYNPHHQLKPNFLLSVQTIAECLQQAKENFEQYKNNEIYHKLTLK